jgi:hypothetical protein
LPLYRYTPVTYYNNLAVPHVLLHTAAAWLCFSSNGFVCAVSICRVFILSIDTETEMTYRSPTCRSIALGGIAFLALMVGALRSAEIVKLIGSPLLILPERMHLIDSLHANDITRIDSNGELEMVFDFMRPGLYAIYTANTSLLLNTNARIDEGKLPTVSMSLKPMAEMRFSSNTSERGLRIFDTRFARGRPIVGFQIERPGRYVLLSPSIEATIFLVPDYTTGKEGLLTLAYLFQAGIIFTPIAVLFYRQYRKQRHRMRQLDGLKHIQGKAFWQRQFKNRK